MPTQDERFMRAALTCAARGLGDVEPNPMVGALLVRDGRELARGWHGEFGGPHAEVEALRAARGAGEDPRGATLYVTLEPCSHHGKTPPCADALIAAGIARVVAAMEDPDEHVAGRGFAKLRAAGIEVTVGVCAHQARELLAPYCTLRTTGRPWVIGKWAQTAEGYLALPAEAGRWITGEAARRHVHEVRAWCQGVLVGIDTVLADDPLLTNRSGHGRQPARVVLDNDLRIGLDCALVQSVEEAPLLVATCAAGDCAKTDHAAALRRAGVEVMPAVARDGRVDLPALLDELGRRRWMHLLVEGGAEVLRSCFRQGLVDEILAYLAPPAGQGVTPEQASRLPRFALEEVLEAGTWRLVEEKTFDTDTLRRYRRD